MDNLIYRIIVKVGYHEAFFDFDDVNEAASFASIALKHSRGSDDSKKAYSINMKIIDKIHIDDDEESED